MTVTRVVEKEIPAAIQIGYSLQFQFNQKHVRKLKEGTQKLPLSGGGRKSSGEGVLHLHSPTLTLDLSFLMQDPTPRPSHRHSHRPAEKVPEYLYFPNFLPLITSSKRTFVSIEGSANRDPPFCCIDTLLQPLAFVKEKLSHSYRN